MSYSCEIAEERHLSAMRRAESYEILGEVGQDEKGATLYRAKYAKAEPEGFSGKLVAIKVIKRQCLLDNVICLTRDIKHSMSCGHKNVTRVYCSFSHDGDLWVVMPCEHAASLARVASRRFGRGMPEREAGLALREVLKGLDYLHGNKWMHRGFDLGHAFVDNDGAVRIDFDLLTYDPEGKVEAPEVAWPAHPPEMFSDEGFELKSDVWGFGIAALKLALGYVPARSYKELAAFIAAWPEMVEKEAKVVNKQAWVIRGLGCFSGGIPAKEDGEGRVKKISPAFMKMVADCLTPEPSKRPSTRELMESEFFRELQGQGTPSFFKSLLGQ